MFSSVVLGIESWVLHILDRTTPLNYNPSAQIRDFKDIYSQYYFVVIQKW